MPALSVGAPRCKCLVEQLVAQTPVEALIVAVFFFIDWGYLVIEYSHVVGPGQDGVGGQLCAVVADDGLGASGGLHQATDITN